MIDALAMLIYTANPYRLLGFGLLVGLVAGLNLSALFRRRAIPGTRRGTEAFLRVSNGGNP